MQAKKLLSSRQIFRYAVPARTVTKKHCLTVEWSIALHMSCHQALTDVFDMRVMLSFVKVEVTVEHDLSVEWSIALHMSCHQALTDVFDTVKRISTHRLGNLTAQLRRNKK